MYLIEDTPDNRRYIGKYIEVFQYPDGRIEIRAAGHSLPYSTYNKVGTIDHGDIVDNKRLRQVLRTAQIVQAQRDDRVVRRPSSAHRADGTPIPTEKIVGSKRQRDLSADDLRGAHFNLEVTTIHASISYFDFILRDIPTAPTPGMPHPRTDKYLCPIG
jgi:hypothetical protein